MGPLWRKFPVLEVRRLCPRRDWFAHDCMHSQPLPAHSPLVAGQVRALADIRRDDGRCRAATRNAARHAYCRARRSRSGRRTGIGRRPAGRTAGRRRIASRRTSRRRWRSRRRRIGRRRRSRRQGRQVRRQRHERNRRRSRAIATREIHDRAATNHATAINDWGSTLQRACALQRAAALKRAGALQGAGALEGA